MQYADIKLNVLIKGKHNNIIGEVQFLLNVMKEFKDKAHNLYAIQRKEEAITNSVSKILPLLLDTKTRLFTSAINGDIKELCKVCIALCVLFEYVALSSLLSLSFCCVH